MEPSFIDRDPDMIKLLWTSPWRVEVISQRHPKDGFFDEKGCVAYLEKKHGSEICYVNFRDKEVYGWHDHKETFKFVNGGAK